MALVGHYSGTLAFNSYLPCSFCVKNVFLFSLATALLTGDVSTNFTPSLQRQNTEISKQIFPEKEYRGLSPNFHIYESVSDLYIP